MVGMGRQFFAKVLLSLWLVIAASGAEVQVLLDANRVATGEGANFTIQVSGGQAEMPEIAEVPNLTMDFQGKKQMISIVNGVTTQTVSFSYVVGSSVAGEYLIPAVTLKVGGQVLQTKPQKFVVFDDGSAKPAPGDAQAAATEKDRFGTMAVELAIPERKDIYLGEIAPVRIQAFLPMDARVQLRSIIQPESGGFTLHNVSDQPQQSVETKDGKQFRVLTWFGGISATKAGTQSVNLSVKAMVALPDRSKPALRPRGVDPNDPFGRGMSLRYQENDVTLRSADMPLTVRALPEEGKPTNFSGAVGEFAFDALEIPAQWKTGEPQRVALRIKGSGNFATMKAPELSPADLWKWYPGQDQFTPGDIASFSGSKVFQYNAIARRNGEYDVAFALSYFDPKQAKYLTITSDVKRVSISGEPMQEEKAPTTEVAAPAPMEETQGLMPLRKRNDRAALFSGFAGHVNPFLLGGIALFFSALAPAAAWWRRRLQDPLLHERQQRQKDIAQALAEAQQHVRAQSAAPYWESARRALQIQLAAQWQVNAHAISLHDVAKNCGADSPVTAFFREADRWSYASTAQEADWSRWQSLHQQALQSLDS